jgi:dimethylhistidine N-methyltransferase
MTTIITPSSRHDETTSSHRQFQREVLFGLARPQKEVPCKYFYDARGSELFDLICGLDEYYLTRAELAILRAHAGQMAAMIGEDCELVEFGSGSATKTRLLLAHLRAPRAYLPVDIAKEHLERSSRALADRFPNVQVIAVEADFTTPFRLPDTGGPKARRVVYFPGSTIGNFSPTAAVSLLRSIARLVGDGGGLLIGFDLDKDESAVWPAYNDRLGTTAAFNLNLLVRINRELGADFDLTAFDHRADYVRALERVEMHLVSREPQVVNIAGSTFAFDRGETIHTECSYKYSPAHFGRLTARAGFTLVGQWFDPARFFTVQYLTVG